MKQRIEEVDNYGPAMPWVAFPVMFAVSLWQVGTLVLWQQVCLYSAFLVTSFLLEHYFISNGQKPKVKNSFERAAWETLGCMVVVTFVGAFY